MDAPAYLTDKPSNDDVGIPAEEKRHDLPYEQISWTNFERLCLRLALKSSEVYSARPYGVQGDEQLGIDIFAYNKERRLVVYQCKNEKSFTPAKIKAAVHKFVTTDLSAECDKFVLCTRESLQKKDRADEVKDQTKLLADKKILFTVWDSVALNIALKEHPQIVYDFFGLNWVYAFCGREPATGLKLNHPIPEKENYQQPAEYLSRKLTKISDDHFASFFQSDKTLIDVFQDHQKIALLG
jgi:NADH:ubiquinone oxidoreductase subunit